MENLLQKLAETVAFIQAKAPIAPKVGIILGTGLGNLAKEIDARYVLEYADIPHFPVSTVESHSGKLIFGYLEGKPVVAMQGRFHYYEGYTMQQVTFPVRVMKQLGVNHLFVSNASGSTSEHIAIGALMILRDHINLQPSNPLIGKNYNELGPRFPDMSRPYDAELIEKGMAVARKYGFDCHTGVYASVPGPNLETKAEYTYLHRIGADAVGMSTVPEVLVAVHGNMKVFAISVITDEGYPPEKIKEVSLEDVVKVASTTEPKMATIIREVIAGLEV